MINVCLHEKLEDYGGIKRCMSCKQTIVSYRLMENYIKSLTHINPSEKTCTRIERIRYVYKKVVPLLFADIDNCRELDIALEHLESSLMWAVKALVIQDKE